jgi:hypothetical protein
MSWFRQRDDTTEHSYFEERLSAYLDGELSPREQETVEQHLAACSSCRWDLSTLRQTVQWASELPTVQVPRTFTIPVPAEPVRAPRRRWSLLPVLQGATALVALLLVFAVAGDAMLTGFAPRSQSELPAIQELAPVVETTVVELEPTVVVEEQVAVTVVSEAEGKEEAPAAAALPEEAPSEPEGEGERMLQMAPSLAVTATETALADVQEAAGTPMGGGLGGTDVEATGPVEASSAPAGTPAPGVAEVIPPTPSPLPSLEAPATRAAVAPPTSEVLASKAMESTEDETQILETRAVREPTIDWLRMAEYVLGVALILLVGTTLTVWVWRRMMG